MYSTKMMSIISEKYEFCLIPYLFELYILNIPDDYCVRAPPNTMVYLEHPHNPRKFVQCSNQLLTIVQECDVGSCFNENQQNCGSCIKGR